MVVVNATTALRQLSDTVTKFENDHPDAVSIVAGDFNHTNMKTVLPKYYQHVSCPTRGDKILDHCYSTIKNAYRSMPRPHYGRSDHSSVFLVAAYRQQLKSSKPAKRNVQDFNDESVQHLQACSALKPPTGTLSKTYQLTLTSTRTLSLNIYRSVLTHVYPLGLLSVTQIRNRGLTKISEIRCMLGMKPLREVTKLCIKHVDIK